MAAEEEAEKEARRAKKSKFALKAEDLLESVHDAHRHGAGGSAGGAVVYGLPVQLYTWLSMAFPAIAQNYFLRSVFEGVIRIVIFLAYVMLHGAADEADIRRTYQYHGARSTRPFLLL